jgi:hypothetical protein
MTVRRIHPSFISSNNTSDGSVLVYNAANGVVEFGVSAGGGGDASNAWVNANDYATYTTLQSEFAANDYATLLAAQANDYTTYTTLGGEFAANDYNSYTTLNSEFAANDYATLLAAQANDYATYTTLNSEFAANDYNSYTTLVGFINIVQDNVSAGGGGDASNAWVNANDYTTYTTLQSEFANYVNNVIAAGAVEFAEYKYVAAADQLDFSGVDDNGDSLLLNSNNYIVFINGIKLDETDFTANISANSITLVVGAFANDEVVVTTIRPPVTAAALDNNAWVNANDYATYTTLQGDLAANDYNSYTTLVGFINAVQDNVSAGGGGDASNAVLFSDFFTVDGSTNAFTLSSNSVQNGAYLLVYLDGLLQHDDAYVVDDTTLTLANTDPLVSSKLGVRALTSGLNIPGNNVIDVLIVAGGGAGEGSVTSDSSGGGGAGGLIYVQNLAISTGTEYAILVGAGGTGGAKSSSTDGSNTTAFGLTAIGGGKGAVWGDAGNPGGSGGGGGGRALLTTFNYGGSGVTNQGHFGGNAPLGNATTDDAGGGGGGAGGPGHSARETIGGEGGVGRDIDIEGNPYTTYYAGGGGGGTEAGGSSAPGGIGGGGYGGSDSASCTAGEDNTGGGGGGSGNNTTNDGGNGGSGVVIIRTLLTETANTGAPSVNTVGSYNIYKFTGSGSITF